MREAKKNMSKFTAVVKMVIVCIKVAQLCMHLHVSNHLLCLYQLDGDNMVCRPMMLPMAARATQEKKPEQTLYASGQVQASCMTFWENLIFYCTAIVSVYAM